MHILVERDLFYLPHNAKKTRAYGGGVLALAREGLRYEDHQAQKADDCS